VETRLRKLDAENLDGLILAQAGLERLELDEEITEVLDPSWMLPAVGQGALGLECRLDDEETLEVVRLLDDPATHEAIAAERAFLRTLQGGCQVPIGASAKVKDERLTLRGVVLDPQGKRRIEGRINGAADTAEELGRQLAHDLIARGAAELLA
jgi:hydroxymethylbilane synthase